MKTRLKDPWGRDRRLDVMPPLLCAAFLFVTGCATIHQTTYLQELRTVTAVSEPPLLLNADSSARYFHLAPRVSYSEERMLTGNIEGERPPVTGNRNLEWHFPGLSAALDLDWRVSRIVALTGGFYVAGVGDVRLYGGGAGIGLLFGGDAIAGRFDGGMQVRTVAYEASSVVVTEWSTIFGSWNDVSYYVDEGRSSATTGYLSLMLNTVFRESPVNGFLQAAVGAQQLADFGPRRRIVLGIVVNGTAEDARVQSSAAYVMLSPGLYFNLGQSVRLLGGVRLVWESDIRDAEPGRLVMPVVQCEVSL